MNTQNEHLRSDREAPQSSTGDVIVSSVEQQAAAIVGNGKSPIVSGWMACQSKERSNGSFVSGGWLK